MAKVGTAHLEIKPVLNEEALDAIEGMIREAVARGVQEGMAAAASSRPIVSIEHMEVHDYEEFRKAVAHRAATRMSADNA